MKIFILKYLILSCSLFLLISCEHKQQQKVPVTALDSLLNLKANRYTIILSLSPYDCVNCYKPVYDALNLLRCNNIFYASGKIRRREAQEFCNSIKKQTQLNEFTLLQSNPLIKELQDLHFPSINSIYIFDPQKNLIFYSQLKNLQQKELSGIAQQYCN